VCSRRRDIQSAITILDSTPMPRLFHYKKVLLVSRRSAEVSNRHAWQDALLVLDKMRDAGVRPDGPSLVYALTACSYQEQREWVDDLFAQCRRILQASKYRGAQQIYTAAIWALGRTGDTAAARNVLEEAKRKRAAVTLSYNGVLKSYAKARQWREALALLRSMPEDGPCARQTMSTNIALTACGFAGRLSEMLELLEEQKARGEVTSVDYHCAINALAQHGQAMRGRELLTEMKAHGFAPRRSDFFQLAMGFQPNSATQQEPSTSDL